MHAIHVVQWRSKCDCIQELRESGELEQMIPKAQSLDDRLRGLINQQDIMLFMKGSPEV